MSIYTFEDYSKHQADLFNIFQNQTHNPVSTATIHLPAYSTNPPREKITLDVLSDSRALLKNRDYNDYVHRNRQRREVLKGTLKGAAIPKRIKQRDQTGEEVWVWIGLDMNMDKQQDPPPVGDLDLCRDKLHTPAQHLPWKNVAQDRYAYYKKTGRLVTSKLADEAEWRAYQQKVLHECETEKNVVATVNAIHPGYLHKAVQNWNAYKTQRVTQLVASKFQQKSRNNQVKVMITSDSIRENNKRPLKFSDNAIAHSEMPQDSTYQLSNELHRPNISAPYESLYIPLAKQKFAERMQHLQKWIQLESTQIQAYVMKNRSRQFDNCYTRKRSKHYAAHKKSVAAKQAQFLQMIEIAEREMKRRHAMNGGDRIGTATIKATKIKATSTNLDPPTDHQVEEFIKMAPDFSFREFKFSNDNLAFAYSNKISDLPKLRQRMMEKYIKLMEEKEEKTKLQKAIDMAHQTPLFHTKVMNRFA